MLKTAQTLYLIFGQIECSENWKRLQPFNLGQVVGADEELFYPEALKIFNSLDSIAVQGKDAEIFVIMKAVNVCDLVVVQIQIFQIQISLGSRYTIDLVS